MKTINLFLEEREYESLIKRKKNLTWKQFVLQIDKESKAKHTKKEIKEEPELIKEESKSEPEEQIKEESKPEESNDEQIEPSVEEKQETQDVVEERPVDM